MLGFQAGTATAGFLSWVLGLRLRVVLPALQVDLKLGVFLPLSAGVTSVQHLVFFDSPPGIVFYFLMLFLNVLAFFAVYRMRVKHSWVGGLGCCSG